MKELENLVSQLREHEAELRAALAQFASVHGGESHDADEIEARYAREVVGKLRKIVRRASRLDKISPPRQPSGPLERYFQEAHDCYLYGFHVACVVLCRALLERALKESVDPNGALEKRTEQGYRKTGQRAAYIDALTAEAERRKILTDDRPELAIRVRKAGNEAIHNFEKFERENREGVSKKAEEVLLDTRKILEDLFEGERN